MFQAGGVFVDRAARTMLEAKLKNSRYGDEEFIDLMVQEFEQKVCKVSPNYPTIAEYFIDSSFTYDHGRPSVYSMELKSQM